MALYDIRECYVGGWNIPDLMFDELL